MQDHKAQLKNDLEALQQSEKEFDLESYTTTYLRFCSKTLSARYDCMNPAITGSARFPHQKVMRSHNALRAELEDFDKWRSKLLNRASKRLTDYINSGQPNTIELLEQKLAEETYKHDFRKKVNKVITTKSLPNKAKALTEQGIDPTILKTLGKDYKGDQAIFNLSYTSTKIRTLKKRLAEELERQEEYKSGNKTFNYQGMKVVHNVEANRLQLFFEKAPSKEVIAILKKKGGLIWMPQNKAWQRKLNEKAIESIQVVLQDLLLESKLVDSYDSSIQVHSLPKEKKLVLTIANPVGEHVSNLASQLGFKKQSKPNTAPENSTQWSQALTPENYRKIDNITTVLLRARKKELEKKSPILTDSLPKATPTIDKYVQRLEELRELANTAWYWISHSSRERAEQWMATHKEQLKEDIEMLQASKKDFDIDQYVDKYIKFSTEILTARSNCSSALVAGPANFGYDKAMKNQKRLQAKLEAFWNWREQIIKKATTEAKTIIRRGEANTIELLQQKLSQTELRHEYMKTINEIVRSSKIVNKAVALQEKGIDPSILKELEKEEKGQYYTFSLSGVSKEVRDLKNSIAAEKRRQEEYKDGNKTFNYKGLKVVHNAEPSINRLQLFFENPPSKEVIAILKKQGAFKWAPTKGAWQRQLTTNAVVSLDRILQYIIPK